MLIRNWFFVISFFYSFLVFSQDDQSQFYNNLNFHLLDVSSGLSHNFINDIEQDSLGFIWVATYDGLNRYDGKTFKQFKKHLQNPSKGIANNYVQEIEVSGNDLFIATDAGLNKYDLRSGDFELLNDQNGLYNNSVSAIEILPDGYLVIGTYRGGLQVAHDMKLKSSHKLLKGVDELLFNEVSSFVLKDSILWIGSFNKGIGGISIWNGALSKNQQIKLPSEIVNTLYVDCSKNLWIGSREGLQVIMANGESRKLSKSTSNPLLDNDVLCFQEDQRGWMWIGTRNGGLSIVNTSQFLEDEQFEIIHYPPQNDGKSVFNRTVSSLFLDADKNMWLGTPTGINFVNLTGEKIKLYKQNGLSTSLSHNRIGSLAKSSGGNIWVGTDGGGLDLWNPEKGKISHFEHESGNNGSLSNNYLLSIFQQSPDSVWIGTYQGGLNLLNPKTGRSQHYLQGANSDGSDVRKIYRSKSKVLWVGTNRGGLFYFKPGNNQFEYVKELGKIDIRDISEDVSGNLWLATYNSGIIKFNPQNKIYTEFRQRDIPDLNSDVVFSILSLPGGDVLAGTRYGGLVRFDPETLESESFTEINGLSNNTINSLVLQDSNYVWMGSYNGLNRYNIQTSEILNISSLDNIQEGEFNIGAAEIDKNGQLYFGGNNGLNVFNPDTFNQEKLYHPLVFEGLKVLNEEVTVKEGGSEPSKILKETLLFQKSIRLAYDQNSFSVDFGLLKYPEAKNITYSYRLKNYNSFWIDNGTSSTANFTSVPPGNYVLEVRTNSGLGEDASNKLRITIVPPFWKTLPAYVLYILLLSGLIWLGSKYYSERVKLRNSLLFEKKQRQLEKNINEERFRFFTAFSHELKTPLTLIMAPVENMLSKNTGKEHKKDLQFIQRNANGLFQTLNKLLEFRKSEEGLSQLKTEPVNVPEKLRQCVKNYIPLAKEKRIQLEYSGPVEPRIYEVDMEKIEVIINNLLSNAIKYSDKGGEVKVSFAGRENDFEVMVSDSGEGIGKEDLEHIFEWYYRSEHKMKKSGTGIGLALSKSFAELHGGTIEVESLKDDGTVFHLKIPAMRLEITEPSQLNSENALLNLEVASVIESHSSLRSGPDRKLILLIDDNKEIVNFLNGIFQQDYDVVCASDGQEGVGKAINMVPDIIISDVMMPEKSGLDLVAELKENNTTSHIPIILLTAKAAIESIHEGYEQGADDYITKPFHPVLLKARVQNLLENRENLKKFFSEKASETSEETHGIVNKEKSFLENLDRVILVHISQNTESVESIANDIGMSRTSLYRKLKAITGLSINEYIRSLKLERAAHLIQHENYSVSQASYEVGFNDTKYFRKVFKQKMGKNPSEYKQQ